MTLYNDSNNMLSIILNLIQVYGAQLVSNAYIISFGDYDKRVEKLLISFT